MSDKQSDKLKAIDIFFDEEVVQAKQEGLGKKILVIVVARVLQRVKNELCSGKNDCFLSVMDLWMATEEAEDATKQ